MCNECWWEELVEGTIDYEEYLTITQEDNSGLQEREENVSES